MQKMGSLIAITSVPQEVETSVPQSYEVEHFGGSKLSTSKRTKAYFDVRLF